MSLFPLFNSLRVAFISCVFVFVIGTLAAYYISKLNTVIKGVVDTVFTLPIVLPPTLIGFVLLKSFGASSVIGNFFLKYFNHSFAMHWSGSVLATIVVTFPLMYRSARSSFENFDKTLEDSAKLLDINEFRFFLHVRLPLAKSGIIAGSVLSFTRALGEYGATSMISGYIPLKTATLSTAIYSEWRVGNDRNALILIFINIAISTIALIFINIIERRRKY